MNSLVPKVSMMALKKMDDDQPKMSLTTECLPELRNWKVGEKYTIEITATLTCSHIDDESMEMEDGEEKKGKEICGEFDILEAKAKK